MREDTVRLLAAILAIAWSVGCGDDGAQGDADADAAVGDAADVDAGDGDARDAGDADEVGNPCPAGTAFVPAGPFRMGSDPGEGQTDEAPEHDVTLEAYCIDLVEVTNAAWRACVAGGGCPEPYVPASETRPDYHTAAAYDDYPVVNVDWAAAERYCAWAGKRLPTEAEWEKAARGGCDVVEPPACGPEDERSYPWGDEAPTCDLANLSGCLGDTDRTGARPSGDGPYGSHDMAGNVWEWVADWYGTEIYADCSGGCSDPTGPAWGDARVLRGGAWGNNPGYVRAADRFAMNATSVHNYVGFRCAVDP